MSDNLIPGDLLEIKRKLGYSHWVLYVGNDEVIHLTIPADDACCCVSFCFHKGIVKKSRFHEETNGLEWRKNNSKDKQFRALPVEEIIQKGKSLLEKRVYNILFFNCEDFCSYCRYGVKQSDQVENATFIVVKLLVYGALFVSGEPHKKENNAIRDDSCRKQNGPHCETTRNLDQSGTCVQLLEYVMKTYPSIETPGEICSYFELLTRLPDEAGKFVQFLGDVIKTHSSWERTGEVVSFGGRCIELVLESLKEIDFLKHLPRLLTLSTLPGLALQAYGCCSTLCSFLGFGLHMFGCVLKRTTFTAEIGDKMDKIGCTLKKWGTKEITDTIVSILGWALDLTMEQKKKLAAGVDSVLLVLKMLSKNQLQLLPFLMAVFLLVWKHHDVISAMSTSIREMEWSEQLNSFLKV